MAKQQFIAFKLNDETYAADIKRVGGITEYRSITRLPNAPGFVEGVINLRGEIVPIINLKERFQLEKSEIDSNTRIILYQIDNKDVGFIVDEASQVVEIDDKNIDQTPLLFNEIQGDYLNGIGKLDGKIIILLNLEKVFTEEEKEEILTIEI